MRALPLLLEILRTIRRYQMLVKPIMYVTSQ